MDARPDGSVSPQLDARPAEIHFPTRSCAVRAVWPPSTSPALLGCRDAISHRWAQLIGADEGLRSDGWPLAHGRVHPGG